MMDGEDIKVRMVQTLIHSLGRGSLADKRCTVYLDCPCPPNSSVTVLSYRNRLLSYRYQRWATGTNDWNGVDQLQIPELPVSTLSYQYQHWATSINAELLVPTLSYWFQRWATGTNAELEVPMLSYRYQRWATDTNAELLVPMLSCRYQRWATGTKAELLIPTN